MNTTALFVGHGSPMNALEDNDFTRTWSDLGDSITPSAPRAILSVSAHWYTRGTGVTAMTNPRTIHDFWGFPPELFAVSYDAPGDPEVAELVRDVAKPTLVEPDHEWGLDHGTWSVLRHMYPAADIPVVQLSSNAALDARAWFALGQNLSPLRQEGILIIGSGNIVHNLRQLNMAMSNRAYPECVAFDRAIASAVDPQRGNDLAAALHWEELPGASLAAAYPDHLSPFYYTLGAAMGSGDALPAVEILTQDYLMGTLSMTSYVWR